MKYITSALVIFALLGDQTEAIGLTQKAKFTDDLVKSLAEDMAKDEKEEAPKEEKKPEAKKEDKKPAAKDDKKPAAAKKDDKKAPAKDAKKDAKKPEPKKEEQEEIPMDAAAIKAYSSVIADAAEDSEPATPVEYHAVIQEDEKKSHNEVMSSDPMGSMIQNEIAEIKDASIKAAKEKSEEWTYESSSLGWTIKQTKNEANEKTLTQFDFKYYGKFAYLVLTILYLRNYK